MPRTQTTLPALHPPHHRLPAPAHTGPAVIAHRGASGAAPENTLAAARLGVAAGADLVENDLHRTRDGALVVHHDATLARTTDAARVLPGRAPWAIADLTLAEVRRVDAGAWFGPEHVGERVPTLAEWAAAVGLRAGMLLEPKTPGRYPGLARDLAHALAEVPALAGAVAEGRVVVQCFDHAWLRGLHALRPDVPVGLLTATRPRTESVPEAARWASYLNPAYAVVDRTLVARVHDHGLRTFVWTVDRPHALRRAARLGVDGLITNQPQRCRELLAR